MSTSFEVWNLLQYMKYMHSTDTDTRTCAVITDKDGALIAGDANHHTDGMEITKANSRRPEKYDYIEHAERNVIYAAARNGTPLTGMHMYIEWFPCVECARAIVQSGIARLYHGSTDGFDIEKYKFDKARNILESGSVELVDWSTEIKEFEGQWTA